MSPIIDLQRRLHEDGRIRIGQQVAMGNGKKRPAKLERFRFTSQSKRAIETVAQLYGGQPQPWTDAPAGEQWEVVTDATEIPVVLAPEKISFSQSYELWSGGGCRRRCDGEHESISDRPCLCDPEKRECKPHTRLSLMLADRPGAGLWRLDTSGWYAATELAGAIELAGILTGHLGRSLLPARLRLEEKAVKRPNPKNPDATITLKFGVPVLDFDVDMRALAVGGAPALAAPMPELSAASSGGLTPVQHPDEDTPSLVDQLSSVNDAAPTRRRANSPPPIPATGLAPRTAAAAAAGEVPSNDETRVPPTNNDAQPATVRRRRARPSDDPVAAEPEPADAGESRLSMSMCRDLILAAQQLFPERDARLQFATNVLGRPVTTFKELSPKEANNLMRTIHDSIGAQ